MSTPGVHYPHRIRLRGPWECEPLSGGPAPPRRVTMPCRWGDGGLPGFAGRVRFVRRFGFPGRIDDYERVWLTFAGAEGTVAVSLNGQRLGGHEGVGPFEFDVTGRLGPRNELAAEVEAPSDRGGLWGEVALEVRRTAYLRGVRAWFDIAARTVRAAGEVVGSAARPLELYVLLSGKTVVYATIWPEEQGRAFEVASEALEEPGGAVRVELIDGATVWYAVDVA